MNENTLFCTCGSDAARKEGFTNLAELPGEEWWVHAGCNKPTKYWLEGRDDMLNFFRGGPLDGTAYETKTLITNVSLSVRDYVWTPEVITSQKTGQQARVWVMNGLQQDGPAEEGEVTGPSSEPQPEGEQEVATTTKKAAAKKTATKTAAKKTAAKKTASKSTTPPPPPVPGAGEAAPATSSTTGATGLEDRRKALKLSRQQLADEAGLTPAKVWRIERGSGRTTAEEVAELGDVLTKLEGVDPQ